MSIEFNENPTLHDHRLKQHRLVFDASIVSNATPASKSESSDIPSVAYVRSEGRTAEADAVEDVSGQVDNAANDVNGIFQVLLDIAPEEKIYVVRVTPSAGTATVSAKLTTDKRLLVEVDSSLSFAAADLTVTLEIDYLDE